MPFTFKLARRIARFRGIVTVFAAAATFTQCEAVPQSEIVGPGSNSPALPHPVSDFVASDTSDSSVTLTFTEVDDGTQHPSNYDIRYGVAPTSWDRTTRVSSATCAAPLAGNAIGTRRTCEVTGLDPSTDYAFHLAPFRGAVGGTSTLGQISSVAPVTTRAAVASIVISPSPVAATTGQAIQLTATLRDLWGNQLNRPVRWASADTTVVAVNSTGLARALRPGNAIVMAVSKHRTGQATFTVTTPPTVTNPGTVSDLAAVASSDTSATLSFTEVNDGAGASASYSIRYAVAPMTWGSTPNISRGSCSTPVIGTTIGARRTCLVPGLIPATTYQFQLISFRGTYGGTMVLGALSNLASVSTGNRVASVVVSPSSASVQVGGTTQLTATARNVSGTILTGRAVTWSSASSGVAQVSTAGLVTAAGPGTTTISATSEGVSGGAQVTVTVTAPVPVASVSVSPATLNLTAGQTSQLAATLRDAGGNILTGRAVTWSSSSTAVAGVSTSGLVTAAGAGTATIAATSEGVSGGAQVTVTVTAPVPVASVSVSPAPLNLTAGQTSQLSATLRDAGGNILTGRAVTWSSSSTAVARVSTSGLVTTAAGGTSTITATSEGRTGQAAVTVTAPVASVSLTPTSASLTVGQTAQFAATVRDGAGNTLTGRAVTWSSSSPAVASVSSAGLVTALSVGTSAITAVSEGISSQAQIGVSTSTGTGGAIAWSSDWRTATGTSATALRDGAKWTGELCTHPVAQIVPATGLGFPAGMTNVLRSEYSNDLCRMVRATNQWSAPAVGQSIYFRVYYHNAAPNGADIGQAHPIQATSIAWEWKIRMPTNGTTMLQWMFPSQSYPDVHFDAMVSTRQTYRIEWRIQRASSSVCKVQVRVYDSSNVLVHDNNTFRTEPYNGSLIPLATRNPDMPCSGDPDFRTLELGNNGPITTVGPGVYVYWGGAAVSLTGWVGPYSPTGG